MIHRVIFGSIERFRGILTEHYAGAFPLWLAPVQVRVLSINERCADYVNDVCAKLESAGIRVESDLRNEKIGFKIREAQLQKIPYMLVVGDKEAQENKVAVRSRKSQNSVVVDVDTFIAQAVQEIEQKLQ